MTKKLKREGITLIDKLTKDPSYIYRLNKTRRTPCLDCGRPI